MYRSLICLLLAAAMSVGVASTTRGLSQASAQQPDANERARIAFAEGRRLFDEGHFEQAEAQFQMAYRMTGRIELLYNIYLSRRDAGNLEGAAEVLGEFVERRELPEDAPETRRLRALERRLAANPTTQPEAQPESQPEDQPEPEASDEPMTLEVQVVAEPSGSTGDSDSDDSLLPLIGIIGMGVGGAALVGSIITGAMALDQEASLATTCPDCRCPSGSGFEADRDNGAMLATTTDVLMISGLVIAGAGAALFLYSLMSSDADQTTAYGLGCDENTCIGTLRGSF